MSSVSGRGIGNGVMAFAVSDQEVNYRSRL
jgi:hypothetical protein